MTCKKDDIDDYLTDKDTPDFVKKVTEDARATLKALAKYNLGATLDLSIEDYPETKTKLIELIDFDNTDDDTSLELSPARSIIAIMSAFVNGVDYSNIADPTINRIKILEETQKYKLIQYINDNSNEDNADLTFMYAAVKKEDGFYFVYGTFDLNTNKFINYINQEFYPDFKTDINHEYKKYFRKQE